MATYFIEPVRKNLHGSFCASDSPILSIDSGDTVIFRTLDAIWQLGVPWAGWDPNTPSRIEPRDPERDDGHCLCGPVAIRGAKPGMTVEVRIEEILPGAWGWTYGGGWKHDVNERFRIVSKPAIIQWLLDADTMTGTSEKGFQVDLSPFMGVMGLCPNLPGRISTTPPYRTGGNLDCKLLVAGTSLFLPVEIDGAMFSVGDGHSRQGDGEVSVTAIESPMERVKLTFILHPDLKIPFPRATTPDSLVTFGLHTDLREATYLALEGMLEVLEERYGFKRSEALAYASVLVDMHITQIANNTLGVHAILPNNALRSAQSDGIDP